MLGVRTRPAVHHNKRDGVLSTRTSMNEVCIESLNLELEVLEPVDGGRTTQPLMPAHLREGVKCTHSLILRSSARQSNPRHPAASSFMRSSGMPVKGEGGDARKWGGAGSKARWISSACSVQVAV